LLVIRRLGRREPRIHDCLEPSILNEIQLGYEGVDGEVGATETQLPLGLEARIFVMTHVE